MHPRCSLCSTQELCSSSGALFRGGIFTWSLTGFCAASVHKFQRSLTSRQWSQHNLQLFTKLYKQASNPTSQETIIITRPFAQFPSLSKFHLTTDIAIPLIELRILLSLSHTSTYLTPRCCLIYPARSSFSLPSKPAATVTSMPSSAATRLFTPYSTNTSTASHWPLPLETYSHMRFATLSIPAPSELSSASLTPASVPPPRSFGHNLLHYFPLRFLLGENH